MAAWSFDWPLIEPDPESLRRTESLSGRSSIEARPEVTVVSANTRTVRSSRANTETYLARKDVPRVAITSRRPSGW